MIEIPESGDDHHAMWLELLALAHDPPVPWVLIGAHMVALHGWARGRQQLRLSRDADLLVEPRASGNPGAATIRHVRDPLSGCTRLHPRA